MPHFGHSFEPSVEAANGESVPSGVDGVCGRERMTPSAASATITEAARRSRYVWSTTEPSVGPTPRDRATPRAGSGSCQAYEDAPSLSSLTFGALDRW
jgi:hypothetical protein